MKRRLNRAAAGLVVIVAVAVSLRFSRSSPRKYLHFGIESRCMAMPVYAGPNGPFFGYLIGGATIDLKTGPVQAIDITVYVDGERRSVWRRLTDVKKMYVPVNVISPRECVWTSRDLLPNGKWEVTKDEFGPDAPLWRRISGGWTPHHGFLTFGDSQ